MNKNQDLFTCTCCWSPWVVNEVVSTGIVELGVLELAVWGAVQAEPLELLLQVVGLRWHVRLLVNG